MSLQRQLSESQRELDVSRQESAALQKELEAARAEIAMVQRNRHPGNVDNVQANAQLKAEKEGLELELSMARAAVAELLRHGEWLQSEREALGKQLDVACASLEAARGIAGAGVGMNGRQSPVAGGFPYDIYNRQ